MICKDKPCLWVLFLLALCCSSCQTNSYVTRGKLNDQLKKQSPYVLNDHKTAGKFDIPPDVDMQDGLSEQEAVNVALWNNAGFQADLADISLANAAITN